ncbi:MAG: MBL fold metallo-hydrolase [Deltaproteobacteria bacterium]|nr:MBL fold metallo-hydrolase [Deltaproteobacteria bacterium]
MSLRFCVLASGSKANAVWIERQGQALLIDDGLSFREFKKRAELLGLQLGRLKGVAVSHEHVDHVRGVGVLARQLDVPVLVTEPTAAAAASHLAGARLRHYEAGETLDLGFLSLETITGSHDVVDPVVFVVRSVGGALGLATDLGAASALVRHGLRGLGALILEFNHDLDLLLDGPYPHFLKQRVRSRQGHLSNEQGAEVLAELLHPGLRHVVLAHLSEVNNTPALARRAAEAVLAASACRPNLAVASQWEPSAWFELG